MLGLEIWAAERSNMYVSPSGARAQQTEPCRRFTRSMQPMRRGWYLICAGGQHSHLPHTVSATLKAPMLAQTAVRHNSKVIIAIFFAIITINSNTGGGGPWVGPLIRRGL